MVRLAQSLTMADFGLALCDDDGAGLEIDGVVVEAVSRFVPGVLGNPASLENESFSGQVLEGPQYTRPAEYRGEAVPEVLSSGDHAAIKKWRADKAMEITKKKRPDLLLSGSPEWKERK